MTMEELQKAIELQYQSKGIARCRYNALNKVFTFLKDCNFKDNTVFQDKSKEELKADYAQYWNKRLNDAENQAINDIYNYINVNSHFITIEKVKKKNDTPENNPQVKYKTGLSAWAGNSPKVLVLGTMPGDRSLQEQAYYCDTAHNSFWKIMYSIFREENGMSNYDFITSQNIALWDCVQSGIRKGSTDDGYDINSLTPNDIQSFLKEYPSIKTIILNGKGRGSKKHPSTAFLFNLFFSTIDFDGEIISLSSTSNTCSLTFEEKLEEWSIISELVKLMK
ncbi:DNA-deoxyinosine glycosylase [Bacteroides gallinarum]|uniref:DNA-deoxyinosine glycosylase n=1 Tax=Bacteroides gallinarum TaxID=376806 RepID=UPI000372537F|nr:DNA-deoxyinosine glycosylase [Bacteroides gallinarum]